MLQIDCLNIPEVRVITPRRIDDGRGFFSEVFNAARMREAGIADGFVQDNHSFSARVGTVRGLHFQIPPFAQAKLVRVVHGAIFDAVVDLRHGSPTFGHAATVMISHAAWNQIYIPVGFAHGFCTLEADTEVLYKVSNYYSAEHDRGLRWDDLTLDIKWPVAAAEATLSEKDSRHPLLADLPAYFRYP